MAAGNDIILVQGRAHPYCHRFLAQRLMKGPRDDAFQKKVSNPLLHDANEKHVSIEPE
jgi:hypothetical protein